MSREQAVHNVLVIDDDVTLLQLYKTVLGSWGLPICILTARNGYEAALTASLHKPSIVITDLNMPVINGRKTLEIFRASYGLESIYFIVVTGAEEEHIPPDIEDHMTILMRKPVNFPRLRRLIQAAIDKSLSSS